LFAFGFQRPWKHHETPRIWWGVFSFKGPWLMGPTKVNFALGAECTPRVAMTATSCTLTSPLITNDQLYCQFDFFNSIPIIPRWVKLVEPYKVRLNIDLAVPDKAMFMQPLLGPDC